MTRRPSREPWGVLVVCVALSLGLAALTWRAVRERDRLRFENAVQAAQDRLTGRLDVYVAMMRGVQGLFAVSNDVTHSEFRNYVARLELDQRYPGAKGIGWARRFGREERAAVEQAVGAAMGAPFSVWPAEAQREHVAVLYVEPLDDENAQVLGFDMSTDLARAEAMSRAGDEGLAILSGRVTLVEQVPVPHGPGFLIYLPVYEGEGEVPPTLEARRERLSGFVFARFRAEELFAGLFGRERAPRVSVAIYDGDPTPERLLFDGREVPPGSDDRFEASEAVEVAGRRWTLLVQSRRALHDTHLSAALVVLAALLLLSLLAFHVARGRRRAREVAEQERRTAMTLSRLALALNSELDQPRLVQRLVDEGTALTRARFGLYVHNVADEQGRYGLFAVAGAHREALAKMPPLRPTPLLSQTLTARDILRFDDVTKSEPFGKGPLLDGLPAEQLALRSWLAAPVVGRNGAVIGALFFGHPEVGVFREEDEALVGGLAAQAAVGLDNARLFDEANRAVHLRDEFLSVASHELRTPLTPLALRLEQLAGRADAAGEGGVPAADVHAAVETAKRQVARLTRLVTDLLDVSRITSGRLRLHREQTDLAALVREAAARVQPQVDRTGGSVAVEAPAALRGLWDPLRLDQVVVNLLDNALKYAPGSPIRVCLTERERHAVLTVRDEGIGIAPDRLPHVFDRFERAVSERHYGGLGLGLYIVREIITAHGGRVSVASRPGEGALFTVELPLDPSANGPRVEPQ